MAIGQDFDSEASYQVTLNLMRQGPCDPRTRNPATWGRLLQFLARCGIAPEACFFTNFFMGVREGNEAVGVFPGAADTAFEERCRQFVRVQLETQQPRLVLTLGMQVPSRLAPLAQQLSRWQDVESSASLDAVGPVVHNVDFPGVRSTCSVVALVHPSFRPSNVGRRRYGGFQGDDAEVEMVREALRCCGMRE
jgi:uracil-DNA glycosylase